jgi:hypothetical protein
MPFGLKNVGTTFWWAMTYVFHDLTHIILAYLEKFTAHSKKQFQHLQYLRIIFQRCRQYNILLNPLKCVFCIIVGHYLESSFLNKGSEWTPSRSKPLMRSLLPRICTNYKVFRERPNSYFALFHITQLVPMDSYSCYAMISHSDGINTLKKISIN